MMASVVLDCLKTTIRLRPRFAETDQMGIVYHANYLVWFHEARDAMVIDLGVDPRILAESGFAFPILETHCRHRAPARYGDELFVSAMPVVERGRPVSVAKLKVRYTVQTTKNCKVIAEGETVSVMTEPTGRLVLRLPECFDVMKNNIEAAYNRAFGKTT